MMRAWRFISLLKNDNEVVRKVYFSHATVAAILLYDMRLSTSHLVPCVSDSKEPLCLNVPLAFQIYALRLLI